MFTSCAASIIFRTLSASTPQALHDPQGTTMAHLQAEGACQVRLEAFYDIGPVRVRQRSRMDHVVGQALDQGRGRAADDALAHVGDTGRNVPAPRQEVQYLQSSSAGWGLAAPQGMPQ